MKKLIDFDGMFDKKLAEYMEQNAGKYTEKQWESLIPKLYKNFGDTYIKSAGDTPKGYYKKMSDGELIETLAEHLKEGVPVSDFLCREVEERNCPDGLNELIKTGSALAVELAGDGPKAFHAYFELLKADCTPDVKETIIERLKSHADTVKEQALDCYRCGVEREIMLEILSSCKEHDDRILEILMMEFRTSPDDLPMYASYLAGYGDERALPLLLEYIDREEINFLEYRELLCAIERLGGEYHRERDFSNDRYFQEIEEKSQILPDFTQNDKKIKS